MSIDSSLKVAGGALSSHRNVLKRAERIERLKETKDFEPEKKPVLGLPKTRNIKASR
jgi:small basic protein (TIGR04137 family)